MRMRLRPLMARLMDWWLSVFPTSGREGRYTQRLEQHATRYNRALQGIRPLWHELREDPSLRMSTEWYSKMTEHLSSVLASGDAIRLISPPAHLRDIHDDWVAAVEHFDLYADLMVESLATGNAAKVEQAYREEQLGRECVVRALAKLARERTKESMRSDRS